jgi:hypothetical protein
LRDFQVAAAESGGGITESAMTRSEGPWLGQCRQFWEGAMKKLSKLSLADQDRIVAALTERVGAPPTDRRLGQDR